MFVCFDLLLVFFSLNYEVHLSWGEKAAFFILLHIRVVACHRGSCIQPSKLAGSDLHPIRIGLETLARSRLSDSCTPACFLTGSIGPKPDTISQNQIRSGLVVHNMVYLWKNATKSESGKLVAGQLHSARTGPNDSCTPACFWTRSVLAQT